MKTRTALILLCLAISGNAQASTQQPILTESVQETPVPEPAAAGVLMVAGGALTLNRPVRGKRKGGFAAGNEVRRQV